MTTQSDSAEKYGAFLECELCELPKIVAPQHVIEEASKAIYETLSKSLNVSSVIESAISAVNTMATVYTSLIDLDSITQNLARALKPLADYGWGRCADAGEKWGSYGWGVVDSFSFYELMNPPATVRDADKIALSAIATSDIEGLFDELRNACTNKPQLENAIAGFRDGDYRSCAMSLFSLIDRCLIRAQKKKEPGRAYYKVGGSNLADSIKTELITRKESDDIIDSFGACAFSPAYSYYYKPVGGFSHKCEGELNRNMLMHGMMTKRVARKSCIKLFYLLKDAHRIFG